MFTDSWIYRSFMRFDLWTKQHGGQGIDRRKMHSFEFGHLRGDYLGLNIVLRSFVMQRWISMKDHTTLCLHAEFVVTHAKPPLSLTSRWRLYTTIENPSYFFRTLSCTEAIQSFISHFNQYSLVDPSWGNIPSWVWQGVSHWLRKLRRRVWHHRHFGNWISWK